ncbi:MAG: anthranilate synthase component I family protein [Bacteroidetes bacterium]|nr:MAG: anthranilate synthase component I family protein [Bacteroidota bacterium]
MLNWADRFNTFCFLDNHQYKSRLHTVECVLAAGAANFLMADTGNALEKLQEFISADRRWLFGHLGYDLKNEIENVHSSNLDKVQFPDLYFFQPEILIKFDGKQMFIKSSNRDAGEIYDEILRAGDPSPVIPGPINIQSRIGKQEYISIIQKLKRNILRGDCYEINFCQEFFAEDVIIDPVDVYKKLSAVSPNPFSGFYKLANKYLLCASPERFLKKKGNKLISQPIKGTSKRDRDKVEDDEFKEELRQSAKDRSENVMVVDLIRNDLSKICLEGTVKVDELYGVYSFPQVHQMISTISGELKPDISFKEIIKATFPMGSMTGAPKKRVLELIEQYEKTKRGIFSGAIGYITPEGDFDFNVVIRSIMYNANNSYLSFQTGSGITFYSEADKEWEECLLKAEAIREVLVRNQV